MYGFEQSEMDFTAGTRTCGWELVVLHWSKLKPCPIGKDLAARFLMREGQTTLDAQSVCWFVS